MKLIKYPAGQIAVKAGLVQGWLGKVVAFKSLCQANIHDALLAVGHNCINTLQACAFGEHFFVGVYQVLGNKLCVIKSYVPISDRFFKLLVLR